MRCPGDQLVAARQRFVETKNQPICLVDRPVMLYRKGDFISQHNKLLVFSGYKLAVGYCAVSEPVKAIDNPGTDLMREVK